MTQQISPEGTSREILAYSLVRRVPTGFRELPAHTGTRTLLYKSEDGSTHGEAANTR